jgi:hypothetical protein
VLADHPFECWTLPAMRPGCWWIGGWSERGLTGSLLIRRVQPAADPVLNEI